MTDMDTIIHQAMNSLAEEPLSTQVEYRVDRLLADINSLPMEDRLRVIVSALDELCAITKDNPTSVGRYAASQLVTRANLVSAFMMQRHG